MLPTADAGTYARKAADRCDMVLYSLQMCRWPHRGLLLQAPSIYYDL